jgi:hypothetical protein
MRKNPFPVFFENTKCRFFVAGLVAWSAIIHVAFIDHWQRDWWTKYMENLVFEYHSRLEMQLVK